MSDLPALEGGGDVARAEIRDAGLAEHLRVAVALRHVDVALGEVDPADRVEGPALDRFEEPDVRVRRRDVVVLEGEDVPPGRELGVGENLREEIVVRVPDLVTHHEQEGALWPGWGGGSSDLSREQPVIEASRELLDPVSMIPSGGSRPRRRDALLTTIGIRKFTVTTCGGHWMAREPQVNSTKGLAMVGNPYALFFWS